MPKENNEKLWKLLQLYSWKVESKNYTLDNDDEKNFNKLKKKFWRLWSK